MTFPRSVARLSRRAINPGMIRLAGRGPLAVLHHVGRRTGRSYATPVMAFGPDPGGTGGPVLTIALTFGRTDWLRNLEAAGGGELVLRGERRLLGPPRAISADSAMPRLPAVVRAYLRLLRVRGFVELAVLPVQ